MSKAKSKALSISAPSSRDEASKMMRELGDALREVTRRETVMNDSIAEIREKAQNDAADVRERVVGLQQALTVYAEANRSSLCQGKTKTVDLGTGKISWRNLPAKVTVRGVDAIIGACKALGRNDFIRTKEEINKDAMLSDPEAAAQIKGVSIGSEGEEITIEPLDLELSEAV